MQVISNKILKPNGEYGQDGLVIRGPQEVLIEHCLFTNEGANPLQADELLDISGGAKVTIRHCEFRMNGLGILIGNSADDADMENKKLGLNVLMEYCYLHDMSRRFPRIHGGTLRMHHCLIENWGLPNTFHEKSFGVRVGPKAKGYIDWCIFKQPSMWAFMNANRFQDPFGPRLGAYSDDGNGVKASNCYKNHWWINVENCNGWLDKQVAYDLEKEIKANLPKFEV